MSEESLRTIKNWDVASKNAIGEIRSYKENYAIDREDREQLNKLYEELLAAKKDKDKQKYINEYFELRKKFMEAGISFEAKSLQYGGLHVYIYGTSLEFNTLLLKDLTNAYQNTNGALLSAKFDRKADEDLNENQKKENENILNNFYFQKRMWSDIVDELNTKYGDGAAVFDDSDPDHVVVTINVSEKQLNVVMNELKDKQIKIKKHLDKGNGEKVDQDLTNIYVKDFDKAISKQLGTKFEKLNSEIDKKIDEIRKTITDSVLSKEEKEKLEKELKDLESKKGEAKLIDELKDCATKINEFKGTVNKSIAEVEKNEIENLKKDFDKVMSYETKDLVLPYPGFEKIKSKIDKINEFKAKYKNVDFTKQDKSGREDMKKEISEFETNKSEIDEFVGYHEKLLKMTAILTGISYGSKKENKIYDGKTAQKLLSEIEELSQDEIKIKKFMTEPAGSPRFDNIMNSNDVKNYTVEDKAKDGYVEHTLYFINKEIDICKHIIENENLYDNPIEKAKEVLKAEKLNKALIESLGIGNVSNAFLNNWKNQSPALSKKSPFEKTKIQFEKFNRKWIEDKNKSLLQYAQNYALLKNELNQSYCENDKAEIEAKLNRIKISDVTAETPNLNEVEIDGKNIIGTLKEDLNMYLYKLQKGVNLALGENWKNEKDEEVKRKDLNKALKKLIKELQDINVNDGEALKEIREIREKLNPIEKQYSLDANKLVKSKEYISIFQEMLERVGNNISTLANLVNISEKELEELINPTTPEKLKDEKYYSEKLKLAIENLQTRKNYFKEKDINMSGEHYDYADGKFDEVVNKKNIVEQIGLLNRYISELDDKTWYVTSHLIESNKNGQRIIKKFDNSIEKIKPLQNELGGDESKTQKLDKAISKLKRLRGQVEEKVRRGEEIKPSEYAFIKLAKRKILQENNLVKTEDKKYKFKEEGR